MTAASLPKAPPPSIVHQLVELPEVISETVQANGMHWTSHWKYECDRCGQRYQKRVNPKTSTCDIDAFEAIEARAQAMNTFTEMADEQLGRLVDVELKRAGWRIFERDRLVREWKRWRAWKVPAPAQPSESINMAACPKCGVEQSDLDGFGVLKCDACGYCSHASINGDVCGLCGAMQGADPDYIVVCPKCQADKGVECRTPKGLPQATHGFRRQMAKHQREAEQKGDLIIACSHCKAPIGQACTGAMGSGNSHTRREKEAAQHRRATEDLAVARARSAERDATPASATAPRRSHRGISTVDLHAPRTNTRCPTCRTGKIAGFQIICAACAKR